ncbi:MAG: hypothetical protein ACQKBY_12155 [Verrucomicrobiales bacterium]
MSWHVELDERAKAKLAAQKRRTSLSSMAVALLAFALMLVVLALLTLVPALHKVPTIVSYNAPNQAEDELEVKKLPTSQAKKPSAPSMASSRVITAATTSAVAIPTPEFEVDEPSFDMGTGDDFGDGGDGFGLGGGGGSSSGFGSMQQLASALRGRLYDFKQTREGEANPDYPQSQDAINRGDYYIDVVQSLERRNFSESAFGDFFKAPQELSLTNLAIPDAAATEGPKYFNAEKDIKPSGWVAHYQGRISVPEDGRYRFVGFADDYMVVTINNRVRLVACWPSIQERVRGRWDPTEPVGAWAAPINPQKLICGDWMKLGRGDELKMDLAVGERPGGRINFILLVEKEGEEYRKDGAGRPILPLFTTSPISEETRQEIEGKFPNYAFEWEKVPVFSAR